MLEVWADPRAERNVHRIEVVADSARFTLEIENLPSEDDPRTSRIAALRRLGASLRVGT